jgi:SAM-dependent methyltransferase
MHDVDPGGTLRRDDGGSVLARVRASPTTSRLLGGLYDPLVTPLRIVNALVRRLTAASHHLQYKVEGFLRPSAEWFDHELDAQWQWPVRGRFTFLERGVLNALSIRPGAEVLELCCGDGFNTGRFYSARAGRVVAIDHNDAALANARRRHSRANVEYRSGDVLGELPQGPFDNVIWDSAMHHFTLAEAGEVLAAVHRALRKDGLLSGYTEIEDTGYAYARTRFSDPQGLAALLEAEFPYVSVIETRDPLRRNLYFFAADEARALPFDPGVRRFGAAPDEARASTDRLI